MTGVRALSHLAAAAAILTLPVWAGACAVHARAAGPALETPVPPRRVIPHASQPIESQPIVASPPVGEVQPTTPSAVKPPDAAPPAPPATPPPAAATPPPVAAERPSTPPSEPPPTLQTTANPGAAEQRTKAALVNATRDLGRIDVRTLSADAKAQYDIARRFVEQANDALNARNFDFAQQLADKAATLAALLQK